MPTTGTAARRHRPEIDGLRAVAVLAVLLFHADLGFAGGYVGVDVFFVLSGYLITDLVRADLTSGSFALATFFERRARRILPALIVVTLATLAAGWWLLLPDEYAELGRSAAAQGVLGANVHFWRVTDYFTRSAAERPLLHTWSLSLEAQFYLVAPFVVLALWRLRRGRRPALATVSLTALLAASFACSVVWVARGAPAAFYLLPGRLWEFLLGSAAALLPAGAFVKQRAAHEALAWTGLALVVLPALAYDERTPFPGLAAVPPCVGTALLLWSSATTHTTARRVLSWRPLVVVGFVSYSLYLWHWPLFAFARVQALAPLSVVHRVALLGAASVLAAVSWRFVEQPVRVRTAARTPRAFAALATGGLAVLLAGGLVLGATDGFPGRFDAIVLEPLAARRDRAFLRDVTLDEVLRGELLRFGADEASEPPELLVWGDSHAMAALPAFDALLRERGRAGVAATYVATAPLIGFVRDSRERAGLRDAAPRYADAVLRHVREHAIRDVVLIANWSGYRNDDGGPSAATLEQALLATVSALARAGARTWVVLQIPKQPFDVPAALARTRASGFDLTTACAASDATNGITGTSDPRVLERIVAAGGRIVDPRPQFADARDGRCVLAEDGAPVYADRHHLTATGARHLLLPLLRDALAPDASSPASSVAEHRAHDAAVAARPVELAEEDPLPAR